MNRGEVWWYEPPNRKARPVCILTRQPAIPVLQAVLVVPASSTVRGIATEVRLGRADGMRSECVLSCDNVFTTTKGLLTEHLATLGPDRLDELCRAVAIATGCRF